MKTSEGKDGSVLPVSTEIGVSAAKTPRLSVTGVNTRMVSDGSQRSTVYNPFNFDDNLVKRFKNFFSD